MSVYTLRKYAGFGFIKPVKRYGDKGNHKGSYGLYNENVIHRIEFIKKNVCGKKKLCAFAGSDLVFEWRLQDLISEVYLLEDVFGREHGEYVTSLRTRKAS